MLKHEGLCIDGTTLVVRGLGRIPPGAEVFDAVGNARSENGHMAEGQLLLSAHRSCAERPTLLLARGRFRLGRDVPRLVAGARWAAKRIQRKTHVPVA